MNRNFSNKTRREPRRNIIVKANVNSNKPSESIKLIENKKYQPVQQINMRYEQVSINRNENMNSRREPARNLQMKDNHCLTGLSNQNNVNEVQNSQLLEQINLRYEQVSIDKCGNKSSPQSPVNKQMQMKNYESPTKLSNGMNDNVFKNFQALEQINLRCDQVLIHRNENRYPRRGLFKDVKIENNESPTKMSIQSNDNEIENINRRYDQITHKRNRTSPRRRSFRNNMPERGNENPTKLSEGINDYEVANAEPFDDIILKSSRACSIAPDNREFGQMTSNETPSTIEDQYRSLLLEQYGFDPLVSDTNQWNELRKMIGGPAKMDSGSQCVEKNPDTLNASGGSPWCFDSPVGIDQYIKNKSHEKNAYQDPNSGYSTNDIYISMRPRVKVIAEKFATYKNNNVEIRKLEEKIVCVEYDVFKRDNITATSMQMPMQCMRAFFSIKTGCAKCNGGKQLLASVPSEMKVGLHFSEKDINDLSEKEIEVMDAKIPENKSYLDDLSRVLKRQKNLNIKKNKTTLDLGCLYKMAKLNSPPLAHDYSNTNLLSKAELQEIMNLILQNRESSAQGIRRRTFKNNEADSINSKANDTYSDEFYKILRDSETVLA